MLRSSIASFVAIIGIFSTSVLGAPARLITSPPVTKGANPLTGPPIDPQATQGQWFMDLKTGQIQSRQFEFYDNVPGQPGAAGNGGGGAAWVAISGYIGGLSTNTSGQITGFSINASITNDLPGDGGPTLNGANSHGEGLPPQSLYQGPMQGVKLTAEFALPGAVQVPQPTLAAILGNAAPYSNPSYGAANTPSPFIIAANEDEEAWYSFTETGGYVVPTWDFGDIAPGGTASRTMNFRFAAPLDATDPLSGLLGLWAGLGPAIDLLMNRETDLKIGDWLDKLGQDFFTPYPTGAARSGNVSAFFSVPEPSSAVTLLCVTSMLALRRRGTSAR